MCVTTAFVAATITIRTDAATEHALEVLTGNADVSRSLAIRQAVLEAAARQERSAMMRQAALRIPLSEPDGTSIADDIARTRELEDR